jgi:hypothetical protein
MGKVIFDISMSLDGYIAAQRLHDWVPGIYAVKCGSRLTGVRLNARADSNPRRMHFGGGRS